MATLVNEELFDYLDHLESEVDKRISMSNEKSLQYLMHFQMKSIIENERDFLKYINSNGTQSILSISSNGLPSVASLNPDLEKICELAEEEKSFLDVTQKFRKGIDGKNRGEKGYSYVPVSEDEWSKELANRGGKKLQSQVGFAISETENGKFELAVREDIHLQGYDQHSKEFPILIREGRMKYHVVWNKLLEDSEESFYVPSSSSTMQIIRTSKQFNDLTRFYSFGNSDFKGVRKPWFMKWRGDSIDYASFLSAGTNTRVRTTENILEAIEKTLEKQISLRGINKNDLGQALAFSAIPFKNAPRTTLKDKDIYNINNRENWGGFFLLKLKPKYPLKFDLVFITGGDKMGQIEYVLPHNERKWDQRGCSRDYSEDVRYTFTKGGINLTISGESIGNEEQYHNLQDELRRVRKG